jgi:hypothetical protein
MAGDGADYNLQNILTNLAVRVGEMEGLLKAFREQWRDQDTAAGLSRRVTHDKMELLGMQVERLANDIMHLQQEVAEIRNDMDDEVMPTLMVGRYAKERKAGAKAAVAAVWGGLVVLISFLAYVTDRAITYFTSLHK